MMPVKNFGQKLIVSNKGTDKDLILSPGFIVFLGLLFAGIALASGHFFLLIGLLTGFVLMIVLGLRFFVKTEGAELIFDKEKNILKKKRLRTKEFGLGDLHQLELIPIDITEGEGSLGASLKFKIQANFINHTEELILFNEYQDARYAIEAVANFIQQDFIDKYGVVEIGEIKASKDDASVSRVQETPGDPKNNEEKVSEPNLLLAAYVIDPPNRLKVCLPKNGWRMKAVSSFGFGLSITIAVFVESDSDSFSLFFFFMASLPAMIGWLVGWTQTMAKQIVTMDGSRFTLEEGWFSKKKEQVFYDEVLEVRLFRKSSMEPTKEAGEAVNIKNTSQWPDCSLLLRSKDKSLHFAESIPYQEQEYLLSQVQKALNHQIKESLILEGSISQSSKVA